MGIQLGVMGNRAGTRNLQFVKHIPRDILGRVRGRKLAIPVGGETRTISIGPTERAIRVTLGTGNPIEAKERHGEVAGYVDRLFAALRDQKPVSLSDKQCVALAGLVYRAWADDSGPRVRSVAMEQGADGEWRRVYDEEDGETIDGAEAAAGFNAGVGDLVKLLEADRNDDQWALLEARIGPLVSRLLLEHAGIEEVDARSRKVLLVEVLKAARDGMARAARIAERDYGPDANSERFPAWERPNIETEGRPSKGSSPTSFNEVFEKFAAEARATGRAPATIDAYRQAWRGLAGYVKHGDVTRVTAENVIGFKDAMIEHKLSPQTIGNTRLPALRSVFDWAVRQRIIAINPAIGVTLKKTRAERVRNPYFEDEEIAAILGAALRVPPAKRTGNAQLAAAKRWVPWLCAYSGARVGEIVQLRKGDIRHDNAADCWVMRLSPEAGTIKTKEFRDVPIHAHLIELGFVSWLDQAPLAAGGYLFMKPVDGALSDEAIRGALRSSKNRLRDWVRGEDVGVTDTEVQPNHAWRYSFKTRAAEAEIPDSVIDGITGHIAESEGSKYRKITLVRQVAAMRAYPRYVL